MLAYIIRHAQSVANVQSERNLDTGLSPLGVEQTLALVQRLAGLKVAALYSSPYRRCIQTAQPIAKALSLPTLLRPELCEFHHTQHVGGDRPVVPPLDQIVQQHEQVTACPDYDGPTAWPAPNEPFQTLLSRVGSFAAYLKSRWHGTEDVVIVISHGSPVARLIEAWLTDQPGPSFRFVIDNAAITALRYHGGVSSLVCLNEVSHLRGLPTPELANYYEDGSIKPLPPTNYW